MVQVLDYNDIMDTIITYLRTQNTGTASYDLSLSLPTAIQDANILVKDLQVYSPKASDFPGIFIKLLNKEPDQLRSTGKGSNVAREIIFTAQFNCVYAAYTDADTYLAKMIRNFETNIRENIDLTSYVQTNGANVTKLIAMHPSNVTFKTVLDLDSPFNRSAAVEVDFRCFIS